MLFVKSLIRKVFCLVLLGIAVGFVDETVSDVEIFISQNALGD